MRYSNATACLRTLCLTGISALLFASLPVNAHEIEIEVEEIEALINERIAERIEQRAEQEVRARVRQSIEDTIEEQTIEAVSDNVAASVESALAARIEAAPVEVQAVVEPSAKLKAADLESLIDFDRILENQLSRIEYEIELQVDTIRDEEGHAALADEWLVMTDQVTLDKLVAEGYSIAHIEELHGLGFLLGTIQAPQSFSPADNADVQVLTDPQMVVDLNHVYLPQRDASPASSGSARTSTVSTQSQHGWAKIGMIDSSINRAHRVFTGSEISEASFTPRGFTRTSQHGTAIASILVGDSDEFTGLSPKSHLYNGVVFATDDKGREFSTTSAIVRAINWLIERDVRLINMSLAGPDNAILARAISSACERGLTVVSAAGNAGPASVPLYPAAYDCTLAITAVGNNGTPYHRANRGDHIDFALPGVDIQHAQADGSYTYSSGTSFAAAIMSGMISTMLPDNPITLSEMKRELGRLSTDVGDTGPDPIYGQGIIRSPATARISN